LNTGLLRYINSAFFALPREVESLHQAIVYLGNASIKTWVTLIALFSALDAIMDAPLAQVVENLPLGPVVVGALLNHEGQAGQALHCTLAYEQSEWDQIDCSRMEKSVIVQSYLDAVAWATGRRRS